MYIIIIIIIIIISRQSIPKSLDLNGPGHLIKT